MTFSKDHLLIGVLMVIAALSAMLLKPPPSMAVVGPKIELEQIIPKQFSVWHIDNSLMPLQASPDQEEALKKIYSQILTRTYVNDVGQRMMLSVVYGDGIDRQLDVHRPEYCYAAQGFQVSQFTDQLIQTLVGSLSLRRMVATKGLRVEPISYWVKIGDKAMSSTFDRKIQKLKQGFTGKVDSGILVRVSSIENDENLAYATQASFINAMLQAIPEAQRKLLIGDNPAPSASTKDLK